MPHMGEASLPSGSCFPCLSSTPACPLTAQHLIQAFSTSDATSKKSALTVPLVICISSSSLISSLKLI